MIIGRHYFLISVAGGKGLKERMEGGDRERKREWRERERGRREIELEKEIER